LPGVAPVAQQQAKHAARNIVRLIQGQPLRPFEYHDPGALATIGRAAAIAKLGRVHLSGVIGWLVWLFVHIMKLVGFRNRVMVLIQWAGAYISYQRSVRLITGRDAARSATSHVDLQQSATSR
jgi:NADH dehydrogenase